MGNLCDPCEQRYLAKTNVDIDDNDSDVENLRDDLQRISTHQTPPPPKNQAEHLHLSSESLRSHDSPHANRGMIKQISIDSLDDVNTPPPPPPPPDDELPMDNPHVRKAISESAARQQLTNIWVKQDTLEQSKSDNRARVDREERDQARSPGLSPQSTAREFSWAAAAGNTEHSQEREMSHTWGAAQAKQPSPLIGSTRSPRDSPFFPALDTINDAAPLSEFRLSPRRMSNSMSRSFTPSAYHTFTSRPTRKQKRRSMPAARLTKSLERVRGEREKRSTLFGTQLGVGTSIAQQAKAVSAAIDGDILGDDDDDDMMDDEMREREEKFLSSFPLRRQSSTAVPETRAEYRSLKKDEGFVHRLSQFQDDVRRYSEHVREMKEVDDAVRKEMDEEHKSGVVGDGGRMVRFNSVLTFHEFVRRTSSFLKNDDDDDEKIGRANTLPVKFADGSTEIGLNEGFKSTRDRKGTGFPRVKKEDDDVVVGRDEKMDADVVS